MISDDELLSLNRRGLFPGPEEDETTFERRISPFLSFSESPICIPELDIAADWIHVTYSNKNLHFFEGGATWIENNHPTIQLRKAFKKGSYLKIYKAEEIITHETVHACRMAFNESRFEEFFAYATSKSPFRRTFGPLLRTNTESLLFLLSCLLLFLNLWFILVPFFLLTIALLRLQRARSTLNLSLKNIQNLTKNGAFALAALFRMTDQEIFTISSLTPSECLNLISRKKTESLRWRLLCLAYFL